jgi:hypothetical protein
VDPRAGLERDDQADLPDNAAIVAAPVQAMSRARRYCAAPQLVPTIATIAVPKPNAIGC